MTTTTQPVEIGAPGALSAGDAASRRHVPALGAYLFRATVINWLLIVALVAYGLFVTPVVVRALDAELYGVWSFLNGLLAYSNLFYVGVGAAFIKYLAQYRALNNREAANRLASVVLVIYTGIGLICLGLAVTLAPTIASFISNPLAPDAARQTTSACVLLGWRLLFMFLATVFSGLLAGEGYIASAASVNLAGTIGRFIAVPLLLNGARPLITLATVITASAGLEALALIVVARRRIPSLRLAPAVPRWDELRRLYTFGLKAFFIDLSGWIINYTDVVIVSLLIGAAGAATYSIPLQLVTYGRMALQGMTSSLLPKLTTYETSGERHRLGTSYIAVSRVTNLVAALLTLNFLTLGTSFLTLWVGAQFARGTFAIIGCLAIATYCQAVSTLTAVPYYQAMHLLRLPVTVLVAESCANLVLSIIWAKRFGLAGVAAATLVPTMFLTLLIMPAHLCRTLGVQLRTAVRVSILPSVTVLLVGVALNIPLDRVMPPASYDVLTIRAAINFVLAAGVASAFLSREEAMRLARFVQTTFRVLCRRLGSSA